MKYGDKSKRKVGLAEDSFFVDCFGYGIAGLLFFGFVSLVFGLFWVVFCWPGASSPSWVPYLQPLRTLLIICLCLIFYRQMARPRGPGSGFAREWEFIALLVFIGLLSGVRYTINVNDGATVPVEGYENAVAMRRAFTLGIPATVFTVVGYIQSRFAARARPELADPDLIPGASHKEL